MNKGKFYNTTQIQQQQTLLINKKDCIGRNANLQSRQNDDKI